jgi:succinate dehydrogenase / fumarate reductase, cytochrome b subunit
MPDRTLDPADGQVRSVVVATTAAPTPRFQSSRVLRLWRSTIGKKTVVALTGSVLVGYLVLHMAGNLTIFAGPGNGSDARIDSYAHFLRTAGRPLLPYSSLLWAVRVLLIASLVLHVTGVVQLRRRNAAARPSGHPPRRIGRSWSSRTMMVTGPLLLAFIVFHILQFTTLSIQVTPEDEGAIYRNVHGAFGVWWVVVLYLAAVGAVGFHLRHGIWSVAQTLGFDSPARNGRLRVGATLITLAVTIGFASVPVLVWTGVLPAP